MYDSCLHGKTYSFIQFHSRLSECWIYLEISFISSMSYCAFVVLLPVFAFLGKQNHSFNVLFPWGSRTEATQCQSEPFILQGEGLTRWLNWAAPYGSASEAFAYKMAAADVSHVHCSDWLRVDPSASRGIWALITRLGNRNETGWSAGINSIPKTHKGNYKGKCFFFLHMCTIFQANSLTWIARAKLQTRPITIAIKPKRRSDLLLASAAWCWC